jgi:hypothetical protein
MATTMKLARVIQAARDGGGESPPCSVGDVVALAAALRSFATAPIAAYVRGKLLDHVWDATPCASSTAAFITRERTLVPREHMQLPPALAERARLSAGTLLDDAVALLVTRDLAVTRDGQIGEFTRWRVNLRAAQWAPYVAFLERAMLAVRTQLQHQRCDVCELRANGADAEWWREIAAMSTGFDVAFPRSDGGGASVTVLVRLSSDH